MDITIFISLSPNLRCSHLSNFDSGSISSSPSIWVLSFRVEKLSRIISTILTQPRIRGKFKNLFFLRADTKVLFFSAMVPSSFRTAKATLSPLFIITPSSTAWPPTLPRRQFFSFFTLISIPPPSGDIRCEIRLLQDLRTLFSHYCSFILPVYIYIVPAAGSPYI